MYRLPHLLFAFPTAALYQTMPPVPVQIWCFLKTLKLLSHENNFFNICRKEKRNILKEGVVHKRLPNLNNFLFSSSCSPERNIIPRSTSEWNKQHLFSIIFVVLRRKMSRKNSDFWMRRKLWKFIGSSLNANFIHYSGRFFSNFSNEIFENCFCFINIAPLPSFRHLRDVV